MYQYDGRVIYQTHDDDGVLEVVETEGVRSLHFGSISRQSSMLISNPDMLYLNYVRSMISWLLFKSTLDDEALMIGLGGGSLAKFLLQNFPECRLRVIEYRSGVVEIARKHFALPFDSRLKISIDDGAKFVRKHTDSHSERYSLLFIDAFDHEGMAPSISNHAFFDACRALMKKTGVLVINLWGDSNNSQFKDIVLWMGRTFDWKILFLPVKDRGNVIGLAFNEHVPLFSMKELRTRAIILEQLYEIEFIYFLKELIKNNSTLIHKIIRK